MISTILVFTLLGAAQPASPTREVRRLALVLAANDGGPGRERLRYAADDAWAFARVLEDLGGVKREDRVLLLEPTRAQLEEAVGRVRRAAEATIASGRRVELIAYYSGHSNEQGLMLGREHLPYGDLRRGLESVPAHVRVAILDSCASGEFTRKKAGTRVAPFLLDTSRQLEGHAFLTSSSVDEAAQESDRIGASFFTHYLVSGLRGAADFSGDRRVTLNEVYQFAFHETLRRTEATRGGPQHPAYEIQLSGTGELVMTDLHATRSGLQLARELRGRVFVRDASQRLVAELEKHAGHAVELGLESGTYRVTLEHEGKTWLVELRVADGDVAQVSEPILVAVSPEPARTRGTAAPDVPLVPVNVALVPMLSVNQYVGGSPRNYFSLNLLASSGGSLHGVAFGVADRQQGDLRGLSAQAVGSAIGGSLYGLQFSGVGNLVAGDVRGGQIAGGVNVSERMHGVQMAGAANVARHAIGGQLSVVNVGGNVRGVQIGVVNIADEVAGAQIGVLNLAKSMRGAPIGLLSFIQDGQFHVELWASDTHPVNLGVRFGSKHFYMFLMQGAEMEFDRFRGYSAAGFGLHFPGNRVGVDVDLSTGGVHENFRNTIDPSTLGFQPEGLQLLSKLRVGLGLKLVGPLQAFGGLALNSWIRNRPTPIPLGPPSHEVPSFVRLPSFDPFDWTSPATQVLFWPGAFLGIRL
jgi:Caspase domain